MTGPAIRTQVDGLNDEMSKATALDCSDKPDLARQEFKDETDVNKVLARYGVDAQLRPPEYSIVDYDTDLQQSLESIREAERAIEKLPPTLRSKYSTWERLLDGAASGEFKLDLAILEDQRAAAAAAAKLSLDATKPAA